MTKKLMRVKFDDEDGVKESKEGRKDGSKEE